MADPARSTGGCSTHVDRCLTQSIKDLASARLSWSDLQGSAPGGAPPITQAWQPRRSDARCKTVHDAEAPHRCPKLRWIRRPIFRSRRSDTWTAPTAENAHRQPGVRTPSLVGAPRSDPHLEPSPDLSNVRRPQPIHHYGQDAGVRTPFLVGRAHVRPEETVDTQETVDTHFSAERGEGQKPRGRGPRNDGCPAPSCPAPPPAPSK